MNNSIKCQSLFTFSASYIGKMFTNLEYPWEIIPKIKGAIESIIKSGLSGYSLTDDGILLGRDVKIASSARIEGPAIIGDGCEIRHGAYLRGSVILGDGCVIGNSSEVKNSILMNRVQVPHFNYVGDSILGEGAHLGAGAICSNLRSDKQSVKVKCGDVHIDTGLRKLGAILGDNAEVGCGTVLCPGTIVGKNTIIYPLTLARGVYPCDCTVKKDGEVISKISTSE